MEYEIITDLGFTQYDHIYRAYPHIVPTDYKYRHACLLEGEFCLENLKQKPLDIFVYGYKKLTDLAGRKS